MADTPSGLSVGRPCTIPLLKVLKQSEYPFSHRTSQRHGHQCILATCDRSGNGNVWRSLSALGEANVTASAFFHLSICLCPQIARSTCPSILGPPSMPHLAKANRANLLLKSNLVICLLEQGEGGGSVTPVFLFGLGGRGSGLHEKATWRFERGSLLEVSPISKKPLQFNETGLPSPRSSGFSSCASRSRFPTQKPAPFSTHMVRRALWRREKGLCGPWKRNRLKLTAAPAAAPGHPSPPPASPALPGRQAARAQGGRPGTAPPCVRGVGERTPEQEAPGRVGSRQECRKATRTLLEETPCSLTAGLGSGSSWV